MHSYAAVSTVGFIVGAAGVAGGVGALVLAPKDPSSGTTQVGVRVVPTANGMVVVGGF
jgi:hypothetical protein